MVIESEIFMEISAHDTGLFLLIILLGILAQAGCQPMPNEIVSIPLAAKCEARWFDTSSDNPECYELQKALSDAVEEQNKGKVQAALLAGANVNSGYYQSIPVLEHAASIGANDIVELLISNGARVNRVRPFGGTALKAAVTFRHVETVRILIARKVDLCEDTEGSALQIAEEARYAEIATLLNDAGAMKCP